MKDGVEFPVSPLEAFTGDLQGDLDSQVTLFLLLGAMYGSGRKPVLEDLQEFRREFPVPEFDPGNLLETRSHIRMFVERYGFDPFEDRGLIASEESEDRALTARRRQITAELVRKLYDHPQSETVGDILLLGLGDPNEFIRTASAISFLDIFDEVSLAIRSLLTVVADHIDELAGQLAETALRRFGFTGLGVPPTGTPIGKAPGLTTESSILIHGSHFGFVGNNIGTWWQPGGNFHAYIKSNFRPNLYSKPDCYSWSGGWSDHARRLAAIDLRDWARNRNLLNFDVLAHSHGGNVAMWATHLGFEINKLVLMSCPVHSAYYQPEFARVKEVVSYQIKLDWVILADGGGIYFNHSKISDNVLPKWFRRHNDTHDPAIWQKYGLSI